LQAGIACSSLSAGCGYRLTCGYENLSFQVGSAKELSKKIEKIFIFAA
jgi:hypothetical protein